MNDLVDLIDGGVDFFRIRPDGIDDDWIATILDQLPIAQRMRPMSTFGVMLETTGPMLRVHRISCGSTLGPGARSIDLEVFDRVSVGPTYTLVE